MRRLSRRLPPVDSRRRADDLRPSLSVRLAGNSGGGAAVVRGADLRLSRARLRAAQHALAENQPALFAVRSPTRTSRLAGRAHLAGIADAACVDRSRTGSSPRGRSCRRASPGCAASWSSPCSTASCFWRATRRISCRRPARRIESGCFRRARAGATRFADFTGRASGSLLDNYSRNACGACGRCSAFPGG